MGVLHDAHGERVPAGAQLRSDVVEPADESAFDAAQLLAVQVDVGLPVDAVEIQPDVLPAKKGGTVNSLRYQKSAWKNESEIRS
jgi:hypothetical protein